MRRFGRDRRSTHLINNVQRHINVGRNSCRCDRTIVHETEVALDENGGPSRVADFLQKIQRSPMSCGPSAIEQPRLSEQKLRSTCSVLRKRKPRSRTNRTTTKSVLRLPDLEHAKAAVLNSLTSLDAQRRYRHAIDEFVDWYCSEPRLAFNRIVVLRYRSHLESRQLAPGTINLRLGAVRRLAYEAADCGLLSPGLAAGIRRVKGVKKLGMRLGNWLTGEQGHALWQAPDSHRLKGKRDRALLSLLLAWGLRGHEAVCINLGSPSAARCRPEVTNTLSTLTFQLTEL